MKYLHKPLVFICFLTLPYLLFFYYRKNKLPYIYIKLLPPLITLIYFNFIMILTFPLPRYTIPLRPYCYILAITNIAVFINYFSAVIADDMPVMEIVEQSESSEETLDFLPVYGRNSSFHLIS